MRLRSDKAHGNGVNTVENVVRSITDNIQIDELDAVIKSRPKHLCVCSIHLFALLKNPW